MLLLLLSSIIINIFDLKSIFSIELGSLEKQFISFIWYRSEFRKGSLEILWFEGPTTKYHYLHTFAVTRPHFNFMRWLPHWIDRNDLFVAVFGENNGFGIFKNEKGKGIAVTQLFLYIIILNGGHRRTACFFVQVMLATC